MMLQKTGGKLIVNKEGEKDSENEEEEMMEDEGSGNECNDVMGVPLQIKSDQEVVRKDSEGKEEKEGSEGEKGREEVSGEMKPSAEVTESIQSLQNKLAEGGKGKEVGGKRKRKVNSSKITLVTEIPQNASVASLKTSTDKKRKKGKAKLPDNADKILKTWLFDNKDNPYPSDEEKVPFQ